MSSKKWVLSDLHLGHKNILKYSGSLRGGSTPEEHDDWIIHQWNSVVAKADLVYVLGDFAMNANALKLAKRLKGQKILVRGNHDVESTQAYLEYFQSVQGAISFKGVFWMTHMPIHPTELRGRINLHGHVHQKSILTADDLPDERYVNCCPEMTYGVPRSLDELLERHRASVLAERVRIKEEGEA